VAVDSNGVLNQSAAMLLRLGKMVTLVALIVSIGGHWALLQSVAWAGMLVSYSQQAGLAQAVKMTFDGQHPCRLCRAIEESRAEEQQEIPPATVTLNNDLKLDLPPSAILLHHPPHPHVAAQAVLQPSSRNALPELPPPRLA